MSNEKRGESLPVSTDESVAQGEEVSQESGAKFAPDGSARPFPGTTVVCHLLPTDDIHQAIVDHCFDFDSVRGNELLHGNYVQLPASSLHMTLFDVVVYHESRIAGVRTRRAAAAAANSNEETDLDVLRADDMIRFRRAFLDDNVQSELRKNIPIKMTTDLDADRLPTIKETLKVPVKPYDENEANKLRAIRRAIGSAFAFAMMSDDVKLDFPYHVTIYYPLRTLSAEQFDMVKRDWSNAIGRVAETVPAYFEIGRVELCQFEDMCHFHVVESVSS